MSSNYFPFGHWFFEWTPEIYLQEANYFFLFLFMLLQIPTQSIFILFSAIFSSMEIRLSSLNFSSVWEPFYELKLYFPLSVLPRIFYILTESFIAVHLFHILVPLKLLGEYHLVLAICYNSCYWFVLHKNVRMTALCQTKGVSTSVSFSDNTRCRGKIIGKKERCLGSSFKFSPGLEPLVFQIWLNTKLSVYFNILNEFFFYKPYSSGRKDWTYFPHLPDPIAGVLCNVHKETDPFVLFHGFNF